MFHDLVTYLTGKRVAVVVAHQDDEALWFGGLLSALPIGTVTHLISVTHPMPGRPDTATRLDAFFKVAFAIGAQPHCLHIDDVKADADIKVSDEMRSAVSRAILLAGAQAVIGHKITGEKCAVYPRGHAMHRRVALAIMAAYSHNRWPWIFRSDEGEYEVNYEHAQKKRLLDFYAPQWTPDGYPAYEPERYMIA